MASCATAARRPVKSSSPAGGRLFKNLDGSRLLAAWRQQGVLGKQQGKSSCSIIRHGFILTYAMNPVHFMSEKLDWGTPQELFDRLDRGVSLHARRMRLAQKCEVQALFFSPGRRPVAEMERRVLDESSVWKRNREVDAEGVAGIRTRSDGSLSRSRQDRYRVVAQIRFARRNPVHSRKGEVPRRRCHGSLPFSDCDFSRPVVEKEMVEQAAIVNSRKRVFSRIGADWWMMTFKSPDGRRLLAAWRRQGVSGSRQGERSAPSSGLSYVP